MSLNNMNFLQLGSFVFEVYQVFLWCQHAVIVLKELPIGDATFGLSALSSKAPAPEAPEKLLVFCVYGFAALGPKAIDVFGLAL
jgi:hypothetical protein